MGYAVIKVAKDGQLVGFGPTCFGHWHTDASRFTKYKTRDKADAKFTHVKGATVVPF